MICNKVVSNGATLKIPAHLSVGEYFLEKISYICDRDGDAVALVNGNTGEKLSYSEVLQATVNVAVGLKQLGVRRGDVVAFYSENRNELLPGYMGALCCGATITMYSTLYHKDELEHVIQISKPSVIVCSHATLTAHFDVIKTIKSLKHIIQLNSELIEGALSLNEVMGDVDPKTYEPERVFGASDVATIFYSSGTTGLPKGVMNTHLNILYGFTALDSGYFQEATQVILTALPWYHIYGMITIAHSLMAQKQVIYLIGFNADKYLGAIQEYKVDGMYVVPPIIVFLVKSTLVAKYDLSTVKCFWCGAAPLSRQAADEMAKIFPNMTQLIQGYGMTETTLVVLKEKDELGAGLGYLPAPGCKVKVVNTITGEKQGPNENGEICVKSPALMKGYVENEIATRESFDDEGYLKTGDIGFYDDKGYFFIVDRVKEIIKYKGYQVAPAQVESVILQHNGVMECGVVGSPDEVAGELPTAFVVPKPGHHLTEQELLEFTNHRLSPLARIRGGVIFVDEIPKSPSGKILRRVLKQRLLA